MRAFNKAAAYQWYLGTAFWRQRREQVIRRADGICEKCKQRRARHVHHLTYLRVFNELPTDLVALCYYCHAEAHNKQAANDNQMSFRFEMPMERHGHQ